MPTVSDIFDVRYGHSLEMNRLKVVSADKGIAFVSRASRNNGIVAFVEPLPDVEPAPAGELTCALSGEGGRLSTFLQDQPFYTAFHVARLAPKEPLSKGQMLFYCMCIHANRYRYSFGRQANKTLATLAVPSPNEIPAWIATGPIYRGLRDRVEVLAKAGNSNSASGGAAIGGKRVKLSDLFDVVYGLNLELNALTVCADGINFVSRTAENNGVSAKVRPIDGLEPTEGGVLTVAGGGSVLETFLQTEPFYSGRDLYCLRPKVNMTLEQKLFFCMCIRENRFRYNYGRQANKTLRDILVPDISAIPHWVDEAYAGVLGNWSKQLSAAEGVKA